MIRLRVVVGAGVALSVGVTLAGPPVGLPGDTATDARAPACPTTCDATAAFNRALTGGYLYISWDRGPGDQRYVIDSFTGFTGAIERIEWWGSSTTIWKGPDCALEQPAPFVISFYHSSGSGPDYDSPARVFDPIYANWSDTGLGWGGMPELGPIECFTALLPATFSPGPGTQWISIASKAADCDYIWAPGAEDEGGFGQWFYDSGVCAAEPNGSHRSFCLYTCVSSTPCGATADANCDGAVNAFDIDPFVRALTDVAGWQATYPCDHLCAADCNDDGSVNAFDIDPFVICLTSGCPR